MIRHHKEYLILEKDGDDHHAWLFQSKVNDLLAQGWQIISLSDTVLEERDRVRIHLIK